MKRFLRVLLIIISSFLALTAILGGIGLLSGLLRPPEELLAGLPFGSYLIPGLSLTVLVGGLALLAVVLLIRNHPRRHRVTFAATGAILIFETVEVIVIGSPGGIAKNLQIVYFSTGTLMMVPAIADVRWGRQHPEKAR